MEIELPIPTNKGKTNIQTPAICKSPISLVFISTLPESTRNQMNCFRDPNKILLSDSFGKGIFMLKKTQGRLPRD